MANFKLQSQTLSWKLFDFFLALGPDSFSSLQCLFVAPPSKTWRMRCIQQPLASFQNLLSAECKNSRLWYWYGYSLVQHNIVGWRSMQELVLHVVMSHEASTYRKLLSISSQRVTRFHPLSAWKLKSRWEYDLSKLRTLRERLAGEEINQKTLSCIAYLAKSCKVLFPC